MKIVKKSLSMLLTFLLIFSSIAVGFSDISPFSFATLKADAASSYSAQQVRDLVDAAAGAISGTNASNNNFDYSGDDGTVLAAAEAAYDYAVNGLRNASSTTSVPNASNTLASGVANTGANSAAVTKLLNPAGTEIKDFDSRLSTPVSNSDTEDSNWFNNQNNYPALSAATKTTKVTLSVNDYLVKQFANVSAIPASFDTVYTYTFVNSVGNRKTGGQTNSWDVNHGDSCNADWHTHYSFSGTLESWHYLTSVSRSSSTPNTTAKSDLTAYVTYFTSTVYDDLTSTVPELMANYTADELSSMYDDAQAKITAINNGGYDTDVLNHFLHAEKEDVTAGAGGSIETYLSNLTTAKNYMVAYVAAQQLNPYVSQGNGNGYNNEDLDAMESLYTHLTEQAGIYAGCGTEAIDFVRNNFDGYSGLTLAAVNGYNAQLLHDINIIYLKAIRQNMVDLIAEVQTGKGYEVMNAELLRDPADDTISDEDIVDLATRASALMTSASTYPVEHQNEVLGVPVQWNDTTTALFWTLELDPGESTAITALEDYEGKTVAQAIQMFYDAAVYMQNVREIEVDADPYYQYFASKVLSSVTTMSDSAAIAAYDEANQKLTEMNAQIAATIAAGEVSEADIREIYSLSYTGTDGVYHKDAYLPDLAADYINRIKTLIVNRVTEKLDGVADLIENVGGTINNPVVNINNFVGLKTVIDRLNETNVVITCRKEDNNYIFNIDGGDDTNESAARSAFNLTNAAYSFANSKGWLSGSGAPSHNGTSYPSIWSKVTDIYIAVLKFKAAPTGVEYKTKADANGNYAVRLATDDDVARQVGEDYYVTEATVDATITKLDKFITSDDFADIALNNMLKFKDGSKADNLSDFIEKALNNLLFTNDMISTIVAALYPMVCEFINSLLFDDPDTPTVNDAKLVSMVDQLVPPSSWSSWNAALDLASLNINVYQADVFLGGDLTVNNVRGLVDLALGGRNGTTGIRTLAENLGLYIFPVSFRSQLPDTAQYSALRSALNSAGMDWTWFDKDGDGKVEVNEGKVVNGEMTEDVEDRQGNIITDVEPNDIGSLGRTAWGVSTDPDEAYGSFIVAIGTIFTPIVKLLRTVLANAPLNISLDKSSVKLSTSGSAAKAHVVFGVVLDQDISLNLTGTAGATATISGVEGFKLLWIPIMEALGIRDSGYDISDARAKSNIASLGTGAMSVTGSGTNAVYNFRTLPTDASAARIAQALFEPLLVLIDQLKATPIRKVTQMLPQLMYFLTFDGVADLISRLNINIHAEVQTDKDHISDFHLNVTILFSSTDIGWLVKGFIIDAVNDNAKFDVPLALGDMLNIGDLLGVDLTDINALVAFILDKAGVDLAIPAINAGNLITAAEWQSVASAGSGYYLKGTAHSADVLYVVLEYVIRALGDSNFINSILTLIGDSDEDGVLSDEELAAISELPIAEIINGVSSNAIAHPDQILAALIELFIPYNEMTDITGHTGPGVPDEYDYEQYVWANSTHQDYDLPAAQQQSLVYLTYGNNWTRDSAKKVVSGIEDAINSFAAYPVDSISDERARAAAEKLDQDEDGKVTFTEAMVGGINSMFSSSGLAGVIRGLATMGGSLAKNAALATVISAAVDVDGDIDLFAWFKAFGSQIPYVREQYVEAVVKAISDYGMLPEEDFDEEALTDALKEQATQANVEGDFASIVISALAAMGVTTFDVTNTPITAAVVNAALTEAGTPRPGSAGMNGVTMTVVEGEGSEDPGAGTGLDIGLGDDSQIGDLLSNDDVYTLYLLGEEMNDGSEAGREMFVDIFTRICADFAPVVAMILGGDDMKLFDGAITIPGYEGYAQGLMQLFYVFGINEYSDIITGEQYYNATHTNGRLDKQKTIDMFNKLTNQLFDWIDQQVNGEYILDGEGHKQYNTDGSVKRKDANFIQKLLELVPRISYFISSNGLSTSVMNIAKPVLAIVDTLRPIVNVDADTLISVILTDILGDPAAPEEGTIKAMLAQDPVSFDGLDLGSKFNLNKILAILFNYYTGDVGAKYPIDLEHLSFDNLLVFIDTLIDTDMAGGPFATEGLDAFIAMAKTVMGDDMNGLAGMSDDEKLFVAADSLTILVSMVLEGLDYEIPSGKNAGSTNGQVICDLVQRIVDGVAGDSMEGLDIPAIYDAIVTLLKGGEFDTGIVDPNWFYAYGETTTQEQIDAWIADNGTAAGYNTVADEARTKVYLDYNNNWNKDTAGTLEANLEVLFNQILALVSGEDGTSSIDLLKLIAENVLDSESGTIYDAKVLSSLIAAIVGALTQLDKSLIDIVGATMNINFDYYYNFCSFKVKTGEGEDDYTTYATYADLVEAEDVTADVIKSAEVIVNEAQVSAWTAEFEACADDAAKKALFLDRLEELLQPLNPVISFLLFGGSYEWFTSSADADGNHQDPDNISASFPYA
ncbi:MAG: hypothetical protein K6G90_14840, partial [Clostridia bacterium]|nr:hypothetical protein [Clostridia bacterium]